jgi:hypothetical protein
MEAIKGSVIQTPRGITQEEADWVIDQVFEKAPAEEIQRSLAKFAVQVEVLPEFNKQNHLACALPETPQRGWYGMIGKKFYDKYKSSETLQAAEIELTALMLGVDEVIWGEVDESCAA